MIIEYFAHSNELCFDGKVIKDHRIENVSQYFSISADDNRHPKAVWTDEINRLLWKEPYKIYTGLVCKQVALGVSVQITETLGKWKWILGGYGKAYHHSVACRSMADAIRAFQANVAVLPTEEGRHWALYTKGRDYALVSVKGVGAIVESNKFLVPKYKESVAIAINLATVTLDLVPNFERLLK